MIFQNKNLFLTSILFSLFALLTACGGENQNDSSYHSTISSDTLKSAPELAELIMNGPRSNYVLTNLGDEFIVSDKTGKDGTISARGKTSIKFTDLSINLLVEKKSKTIPEKELNTLVELYVAFFNRVPDADGMSYWIDEIKAGMTVDQLANNFYNAAIQLPEVTHYSANMTSADFVRIIYKNVLGRTGAIAPSEGEVNYWANELDSGRFSKGRLVVTMLNSAHTFVGDAKWGWVPQLLDNKVSVGKYFSIEQGLNFNTPQESITQGVAIAAAISPSDVSKAKERIPASDKNFSLSKSITSIVLTPNNSNINQGVTLSYQLIGTYLDGSTQLLNAFNWSSSKSDIASVNISGVAKGIAPGVTIISATYGSKSVSTNLVVNESISTIQSIIISPSTATIALGNSQQFTATAIYSNGTRAIVTPVWKSNNLIAASIDSNGLAKSEMSTGATTIVATFNGVSASANLSITEATVKSIKLSTLYESSFPVGVNQNLTATASMSDGWSKDFTKMVVWTSSNPDVATVNAGVITPLSVGTANIIATYGGQSASYSFVVNAATPTEISIGGPDAGPDSIQANTFSQGSSIKLRLGVFFSDRSYFTSVSGNWLSSDTTKLSINNSGVFFTNAPGNVKISATFGGLTATRNITIATPLSRPSILLTCNETSPMSMSAATWNAAYASDPTNLTKWLDVDWVSCNSRVVVKLIDVKSNFKMFEAITSTNNVFYAGKVFSNGRTPQLAAGDVIKVGYYDSLGFFYYTLYSITVKP